MITYHRASTVNELHQILALQQENLPTALSEEIQKREGFVTVHHDFDLLKRMNDACPHIIAKEEERLVGYTLCMHPKFGDEIEILRPMFREIHRLVSDPRTPLDLTPHNFIVMGQVCIDANYRKQGIFRKLYETMLVEIRPQFHSIITEVDQKNARSLEAHYAIGFKLLSQYNSKGHQWELISLS